MFVLIPGAGGAAWYWHRVVPELRARGHEAVAVDLPGADESAGLPEYADAVVAAIGGHHDVVVVAQSMGGFTAPVACERAPVRLLVLVNAMIPLPGETPGDWWADTGWEPARIAAAQAGGYPAEFDLATYFLHDVPADVAAAGEAHSFPEADIAFGQPCAIEHWPDVPTVVLAGQDDRFFPLAFQRQVAWDRLGMDADVVPGGHLAALSHPAELADRLTRDPALPGRPRRALDPRHQDGGRDCDDARILTQLIGCYRVATNQLLPGEAGVGFPDRVDPVDSQGRTSELVDCLDAAEVEAIAEQVFVALADPSRRAILTALTAGGPATATDLAGRLPITRQAIAKHLSLLSETGLVKPEPGERRRVRCRLRSGPMQVAQEFLAALARDWDGPLDALKDHFDRTETKEITMSMKTPPIVTAQEWEAARQQLLVKEKEVTRARDALAAERRRMPWLAVEKEYEFDGPEGKASLLDLFEGRRQLVIYRAFFEPGVLGWPDHACHGCSMMADQVAHVTHLNARDTTFAYASRAPQPDIARLKARMGWAMPWYTVTGDWDTDFGVDEYHGTNAFLRDGDQVFRTYFLNNRGDEALGSTWSYLDMTALGRQEKWEDSPEGYPQSAPYNWWNWHDEYDHPELSQGRMRGWE